MHSQNLLAPCLVKWKEKQKFNIFLSILKIELNWLTPNLVFPTKTSKIQILTSSVIELLKIKRED